MSNGQPEEKIPDSGQQVPKQHEKKSALPVLIIGGGALLLLAAAALFLVPAFQAAGVGDQVKRVRADLQSLGLAAEHYLSDHGQYPASYSYTTDEYDFLQPLPHPFISFVDDQRTSGATMMQPKRYLALYLPDPFAPLADLTYSYYSTGDWWILWSAGPDRDYDLNGNTEPFATTVAPANVVLVTYDATNGTISNGDIWLTAGN